MVFSGIGMTRISHRRLFQRDTVEDGMGCIPVQVYYGATSYVEESKRSWIHRHVWTIIVLHWKGSFVWEDWIFQQDNAAIHTVRMSKDIFQANNIRIWIIHRVHRTRTLSRTSGDEEQGTFIIMKRSLQLWVLSVKLCSPPGETFRITLSKPQLICEVINKNGWSTHYWMQFLSLFTLILTLHRPFVSKFWPSKIVLLFGICMLR